MERRRDKKDESPNYDDLVEFVAKDPVLWEQFRSLLLQHNVTTSLAQREIFHNFFYENKKRIEEQFIAKNIKKEEELKDEKRARPIETMMENFGKKIKGHKRNCEKKKSTNFCFIDESKVINKYKNVKVKNKNDVAFRDKKRAHSLEEHHSSPGFILKKNVSFNEQITISNGINFAATMEHRRDSCCSMKSSF